MDFDFESAVTEYIISELALRQGISSESSKFLWEKTLISHRDHSRWHDYELHCKALGLGKVWQTSHQKFYNKLHKFPGVDEAIKSAQRLGPCWIASDATNWVVKFKLESLHMSKDFSEIFTIDRCNNNKGSSIYWQTIASSLPNKEHQLVFVDNRFDCIATACKHIRNCIGIIIDSPDHSVSLGFGRKVEKRYLNNIIHSTHSELSNNIENLIKKIQSKDILL